MSKLPDLLSEAEIELVMQYRRRQASTPRRLGRWVTRASMLGFAVLGIVVWYQAAQIQSNWGLGDIPAPLSWIVSIFLNAKS